MLAIRNVLNDTTPGLRPKIIAIYSLLIGVNVTLWVLTAIASLHYGLFLGLAVTAYGFGLRHAVDADHISAIDNVTRKLMQENKKPVAVGFFFSLGHSTVVFLMSAAVAGGSLFIKNGLQDGSALKRVGGLIGTSVSALFLFVIAIMNIVILIEIVRTFRTVTRGGVYDEEEINDYLNRRGFFARIFRGLFKTIDKSWKMYPVGFLFGLGFDTATEVGLLAVGSVAATTYSLPFYIVILLPLLFTAGMSLADTTDGIMMLGAYGWAFVKPVRKLFYNMSITLISVLVAVLVGTIETLGILQGQLNATGGIWDVISHLNDNFGLVGAGIIGIFVLSWCLSWFIYRINRYDALEPRIVSANLTQEE